MQSLVAGMPTGSRRSGDDAGEAMPVRPDRPLDLSGGAAAGRDFDD